MRAVSKKRAVENRLYTKVREAFLDMHIYCVHHKAGRAGKHLTDMSQFMAVCADCHD